MKTLTDTLTAHLRGFNIPREVAHRVMEALKLFENSPVGGALNAIGTLKDILIWISDNSGTNLSIKQKLAIRKAYCVIKYPDSAVTIDMLAKDREAISSIEPVNSRDSLSTIRAGVETITGFRAPFNGFPSSLALLTYRKTLKYHSKNRDFHKSWARRYIKATEQYAQMPNEIKAFRRWSHVFSDVDIQTTGVDATDCVGEVGVTFEQGMKVRLFASPHLHIQAYLEPVKRHLQDICNQIPEDFHGDQPGGRLACQAALREGKVVHCYDLSSATHRFPWSLQQKMLRLMDTIPQDYLQVLDYAVKGVYHSRIGDFQWSSGQPLGLGPSFFAFSLCHHAIIRGLFARMGKDPSGGYVLLGDDVAIFDRSVAKGYVKIMRMIGCVINTAKSIISSDVAEFAGAYIDHSEIINIGKFREVSFSNEMDYSCSVWDTPAVGYESVRTFVRRGGEDLSSLFISQYLLSKSNRILSNQGLTSPSHQIKKLNREFVNLGVAYQLEPTRFDESIGRWAEQIIDIFNWCPDCFPNAVAPHYLSASMKVMLGLIELAQSAIDDSSTHNGMFIPRWWFMFCAIVGGSPESFSIGKLVRLVSRFLMQTFFIIDIGENTMYNRFARYVKKGSTSFDKIYKEGGSDAVVKVIIDLAHSNSNFVEPDYVEQLGSIYMHPVLNA